MIVCFDPNDKANTFLECSIKYMIVLGNATLGEYACQMWHFNIQFFLSDDTELIEKRALITPNIDATVLITPFKLQ